MDTSPQYIRMCEKATEIQEIVKPHTTVSGAFRDGDWVYCHTAYCLNDIRLANASRTDFIWLPRQDQLQEMCKEKDIGMLLVDFFRWFEDEEYIWALNNTMEQLWLAYVMHEKYRKVWNGEDWEEIK